ncbi:ATP-binding protein [Pseudomonas protegens]|uniref:ATP-binding protein n=1 Tax=Pseudomonas protegens TaxID=380021 RepID=A0A2T6GBF6_9PSED|nr:ATP-binding protein [Pseudomonas protegens]PUA41480.1 ATP-binding protein [Pseudomonas protegens]
MLLPFELDPRIIHHIIYSQAGSVGKAIIELLMNSVDADATSVRLTMTREGFKCADDGRGFVSRDDVVRYFGRFGTPHQEGDVTYGRFRLGRGQIMAHATTEWISNRWAMTVDTRSMGYNYELEDLSAEAAGCSITGTWYEPLNELELMSATQEIRDLVRYTPISVELNGRVITRNPAEEKWDFEDEWAYYRAKEEGPVSIYNQGVLVRHDSSHVWGAGGLIVSKQAINLNVSRTEILRKTCPVWKAIAKTFGRLAEEVSTRLGEHRKTEARREKSARSLLSGDPKIEDIFCQEEVITLLPGKRHVSLHAFLQKAHCEHRDSITVVEYSQDVPKGEAIAREGIIQVVHPKTLERFGCNSVADFEETLQRVLDNVAEAARANGRRFVWWSADGDVMPKLVAFATLREAFQERMRIVDDKKVLDKETRRAWTALRWCVQHYAGACLGARRYGNGRVVYGEKLLNVLLGESNTAEAWTDGETYLAIECRIVKRLKVDPLKTAAYIFGLVEHEVAHQGDSLDCGHDEAFYQRYHDISISMSPERQRFIHMWLMKYTMSMENEGKKKLSGRAWQERYLVDRVGNGRVKRGLTPAIEDLSAHALVSASVPEQNPALLAFINHQLGEKGVCPEPTNPADWAQLFDQARLDQLAVNEQQRDEERRHEEMLDEEEKAYEREREEARIRIAQILGLDVKAIEACVSNYLCDVWMYEGIRDPEQIRQAWANKEWEQDWASDNWCSDLLVDIDEHEAQQQLLAEERARSDDPRPKLDKDCRDLVHDGETWWQLKRNSAAAGFWRVEDYLKWRHVVPQTRND